MAKIQLYTSLVLARIKIKSKMKALEWPQHLSHFKSMEIFRDAQGHLISKAFRPFRSEAARVWNSLPNEVRLAESYPQFRRLILAWEGPGCNVLFVAPEFNPCFVIFYF